MKVPILKIKNLLITSLQVEMTDQDAVDFQSDVLRKLAESEADGIVLDITGLEVVGSFMARILNETATMSRLVGAEAVVCGMRPAVALALVEMGRELIGVETALNLEHGMEKIEKLLLKRKGADEPARDVNVDPEH